MFDFFRRRRRDALRAEPFPPAWRVIVDQRVPAAARWSAEERKKHEGLIQVFLAEKPIEGCGGLELTDEIRVTIAAQACRLLLHLDGDEIYPRLDVIRVYPHAYRAPIHRVEGGVHTRGTEGRLGESWVRGIVVLAWDAVSGVHDGHNVTVHEFAHQLDQMDGVADGTPILPKRSMYASWVQVLEHDFKALRTHAAIGHDTVLDPYGAKNPAEFFAVATEAFFERPDELKRENPELYEQLKAFYRQDPARV